MRAILFACLLLSITTHSYSQELTPEERLRLLDDEHYVKELQKAEEETITALNRCMDSYSSSRHVICGKTAIYYLDCVLRGLHKEGANTHDMVADCATASRIQLKLLKIEMSP